MEPMRDRYEDQAELFWPRTGENTSVTTERAELPALATLACDEGLLTREQVREAVAEGVRSGERLGEVLLRLGWLDERQLACLIARQQSLPFLDAVDLPDESAIGTVLSPDQVRAFGGVDIGSEDGRLLIALADPSGERLDELSSVFGEGFSPVVVTRGTLDWLLERADAKAGDSAAPESGGTPARSSDVVAPGAVGGRAAAVEQQPDGTPETRAANAEVTLVPSYDGNGASDVQAELEQADALLGTLRVRFEDLRLRDATTRRELVELQREVVQLRAELQERDTRLAERDTTLVQVKKALADLSAGL